MLQIDTVFINVSKGQAANSKDLKKAFGDKSEADIVLEVCVRDRNALRTHAMVGRAASMRRRGGFFHCITRALRKLRCVGGWKASTAPRPPWDSRSPALPERPRFV